MKYGPRMNAKRPRNYLGSGRERHRKGGNGDSGEKNIILVCAVFGECSVGWEARYVYGVCIALLTGVR